MFHFGTDKGTKYRGKSLKKPVFMRFMRDFFCFKSPGITIDRIKEFYI